MMLSPDWHAGFNAGRAGRPYVWPPDAEDYGEFTLGFMDGKAKYELRRAQVEIKPRSWWRRLWSRLFR